MNYYAEDVRLSDPTTWPFPVFILAMLLAFAIVIGAIGAAIFVIPLSQDDAAFVQPRAQKFYAARGFRVVGYQGYNMDTAGRCYWYTLEREHLLYQSCLLQWRGELHEYNLRGVGVPAVLEKR